MRYLPLSCCFYKGSQSPLISPGSQGGLLRERETGFIPRLLLPPATSDGSRTVKPRETRARYGWFWCSLVALQDPPQTLARTGSRRARLSLSPLSVCFCLFFFCFFLDGPMGRHTGTSGCSQGRLVGLTNSHNTGQGGSFFCRKGTKGALIPLRSTKLLLKRD